ncbi:MAG: rhodanese-like domain-containing protein [Gammaproteobacteria bacterium]|nr:rhodanese-like domain-containing protein [Gammaproteobacteria bacterium]
MMRNATRTFLGFALALVFFSQLPNALAAPGPASSIPKAALVQPADLAATLRSASAPKPLILHVGFHILYMQAHIPGSEYAGPASEQAGLQLLKNRVAKLPKNTPILIYCGCCPWGDCPNIAAAYDALRALGFTQVKALYIADNFGTDWMDRGYPVARGG